MITEAMKQRFREEARKFPDGQAQSAVIACLTIVQDEFGWVSGESCIGAFICRFLRTRSRVCL